MSDGPPPKDPEKRQRMNRPAEITDIGGGAVDAPDMPAGDWAPEVARWWSVWVESPQASQFGATDWQRLEMLVPLVDQYWAKPDTRTLAEIRQNEERLGATAIDRKRLGWRLAGEQPDAKPTRKPTRAKKDPRREHLKAV